MCFDFIVLVLAAYKLLSMGSVRSRLVIILIKEGLVYFLIAYAPL